MFTAIKAPCVITETVNLYQPRTLLTSNKGHIQYNVDRINRNTHMFHGHRVECQNTDLMVDLIILQRMN